MHDPFNSAELRRLAMACAAQADRTYDSAEQERLKNMREALLDLARNADWLAGRKAA